MGKAIVNRLTLCGAIGLACCSTNAAAGALLDLYRKALDNNPTLLSRQFQVEQAKATEDQAFSRLLPQVSATGIYSQNRFDSQGSPVRDYPGLRGTVQARQSLFDLASYLRYRGAEDATRQSEEQQDAYRMQLAGDLVDHYLLTLEAADKMVYLQEEKKAVEAQIKRLSEMLSRHMAKVTDLYSVEAYFQELDTQAIEAANEKAIAMETLREISGMVPETLQSLSIQAFPEAPINVEDWIKDAINSNPNLLALKAGLDAAENIISASKAEHLPQLALQVVETYSDQSYDNRVSPPYNVSSVNLQLNVPIYEGGRVDAAVREAVAKRQINLQEYERIRRQIERETRNAYLNASANYAKIKSTQKHLDAEKKAQNAKQQSYEYGVSTIVDVLESIRDVFKAQTEHQKACYDYARSLIMLHVWSGGLNMQSIEDIDRWFTGQSG